MLDFPLVKKYFQVFKLAFEESVFYRSNTFVYFFRQTLWFFAEILIWLAVFQEKNQIGSYDLQAIVVYFLLVYLLSLFIGSSIDSWLSDNIISGGLTRFFLIPISVHFAVFFQDLGRKTFRIFWILLLWFVIFIFFRVNIHTDSLILFSWAAINSLLLTFLFRLFLGMMAFWFVSIKSLLWVIQQVESFLGGGWLLLSFLPLTFSKIAGFFPFGLSLSFPIRIFQGNIDKSEIMLSFLLQYGWMIVFYLLISVFWQKGLK